jgi:uncharacterized SAM-binding protein YcdF (DUF218 family)
VIDAFLSIVKPIDAPGSIPFLILSVVAGIFVIFVWPRSRRWGGRWLLFVLMTYIALATPIVSRGIASSLPSTNVIPISALSPIDTLVIFDGDNRRGRVNTAREIVDARRPAHVWVLGSEADWFVDELVNIGVPIDAVRVEISTTTTREQLAWVQHHVAVQPRSRFVVIASRLQVPRISSMARAAGLEMPLVAAPVDHEPADAGSRLFVPSYFALRVSRDALYEHAALAYYRRNGWTK